MTDFRSLTAAFILAFPSVAAGTQIVVPKEDPDAVLHNPDMGWVLYENYPLDGRPNGTGTMNTLPDESFPGCDNVAVMFAWSDVEKSEGVYDWSRVDAAWDYWLRRGKTLHLRMSTEPLFGWSRLKPPGGLGIPDWLLERIPTAQKEMRTDENGNTGWHVDARNPAYQERLRVFLKETQAHFSGKRHPALIDLRGFGRWGEWHTGYPYASQKDKREALNAVLDIWCEAFPGQMLALSYSHDPDGPDDLHAGSRRVLDPAFTANYEEYLRFSAFDLAMKRPTITLRRDGAGGAVSSNQRKLSQYTYRVLRRAPQASEFVGGYGKTRPGGPDYVKWVVDDALSLHPNYVCLLGYGARDALAFMKERPDLVDHGLRGMGYRLVPVKAGLPKAIVPGEKFVLNMQWINRAAGRPLRDYTLRVRISAGLDRHVPAEIKSPILPTSQWLQGDTHITRTEVVFPTAHGITKARLQISLFDPLTERIIQLPLADGGEDGFYTIAEVSVES
jgi:hypothetical protein